MMWNSMPDIASGAEQYCKLPRQHGAEIRCPSCSLIGRSNPFSVKFVFSFFRMNHQGLVAMRWERFCQAAVLL